LLQKRIAQGFNYNQKPFLTTSKLNAELAEDIVADWYNTGANYNYDTEPSSETAGNFIVLHMIFIITFLELIENLYTKHRNRFTIYSI